jgi:hypothetical protein
VALEGKFDKKFVALEGKFDRKFVALEAKFELLAEKVEHSIQQALNRNMWSLFAPIKPPQTLPPPS